LIENKAFKKRGKLTRNSYRREKASGKFDKPDVKDFLQATYVLALKLSLPLIVGCVFISSYYNINILNIFINPSLDGGCYENQPGMGIHCFGDFGYTLSYVSNGFNGYWESPGSHYPPLTFYVFTFFKLIAQYSTYQLSLAVYLFLLITSCLFPAYKFYKLKNTKKESLLFALTSLGLLPVIMTLDRGNLIGLCVPLVLYYITQLNSPKQKKKTQIFVFCFLVGLKPQFLLLTLINFGEKQRLNRIRELLFAGMSYLVLFLIGSPLHVFSNIELFIKGLLSYGAIDFDKLYSYNYTFAQGIHNLLLLFNIHISPSATIGLSLLFSAIVLIVLALNYRTLSTYERAIYVVPLIFLVPSVSYAYYSVILLPLAFLSENTEASGFSRKLESRGLNSYVRAPFFLTITPLYIGGNWFGSVGNPYNLVQQAVPSIWFIYYLILILVLSESILKKSNGFNTQKT